MTKGVFNRKTSFAHVLFFMLLPAGEPQVDEDPLKRSVVSVLLGKAWRGFC